MPIPIAALLAGAGVLSSLLKSQQYYPAAEAPSRGQIYGDALGAGLGGLLGGSILGDVGGAAGGPTILNPPGGAAAGQGNILDLLTNGGFTGAGVGQSQGGLDLNQIIGLIGAQQPRSQNPGYGLGAYL